MSIRKPDFGNPPDPRQLGEALLVIMGRTGGGPLAAVPALEAGRVTAAPTAAQFNALVDDVARVRATVNALLERLQD